ncbi:MAG: PorT family protein [Bacteroidia bacterium]|nr:PorT family protein [Bacteroidota bacterium]MBK8873593.1 PorT family protein [Bacteroidota bacterium]MBP9081555.1 PorT family protein [Bacteroidia bacterium]
MKNTYIFILCCLTWLSNVPAFGQHRFISEEIKISWYSRTALQFSNVQGSYSKKESKPVLKSGPVFGGFFSVAINDYLHVEPGIAFSIKGSRIKPDYKTVLSTDEQTISIHEKGLLKTDLYYVEWPIMVTYKMESKVTLGAGIYAAMLMKARYADNRTISTVNNGNLTVTEIKENSSDMADFTRTDAGIMISAGYILRDGLEISGFYNKGLMDVKDPKAEFSNISFGLALSCRLQQF